MKKNIVFITEGKSFIVNAIIKNLKEENYEITQIEPEVKEINAHRHEAQVFIFYLGEFISDATESLVYLKDLCTEEGKLLILIGNPADIKLTEEHIPATVIAAAFERPVDVKKLLAELDNLFATANDQSRKKNILLVDDDETFLKMVKGWLSERYRVTIVTSGAQAMMYVAENRPDLILLDYEMPVTSGPQVLEMLRSEKRVAGIPVIFLTGKGDRESVMQVLAMKPDGYLLKSMQKDGLLAAIEGFFEKQRYAMLHHEGN